MQTSYEFLKQDFHECFFTYCANVSGYRPAFFYSNIANGQDPCGRNIIIQFY